MPGVAATRVVVRRQREDAVEEVTATVGAGVDLNPKPAIFFVQKCCLRLSSAAYILMHSE